MIVELIKIPCVYILSTFDYTFELNIFLVIIGENINKIEFLMTQLCACYFENAIVIQITYVKNCHCNQ